MDEAPAAVSLRSVAVGAVAAAVACGVARAAMQLDRPDLPGDRAPMGRAAPASVAPGMSASNPFCPMGPIGISDGILGGGCFNLGIIKLLCGLDKFCEKILFLLCFLHTQTANVCPFVIINETSQVLNKITIVISVLLNCWCEISKCSC